MEHDELYARYSAGDKGAMGDILKQYEPLISNAVVQYKDTGLDPDVLGMEAKKIVVRSMKNYDPSKGNLTTHIQSNLKSMFRETNRANRIYIPDARASSYRKYKDAFADMSTKLNRPPTDTEMADHLKMGVSDIRRLSKETGVTIAPELDMYESDYELDLPESPDVFIKSIKSKINDPIDISILNSSFNGSSPKSNTAIAKDVGLSEGAVRLRKERLIKMIRGME